MRNSASLGEYIAASWRWKKRNAEQPRICNCGKPGTVVVKDHGNTGWIPVEFWSCEEHKDVPLDVAWIGGVPQWKP